MNEQKGAVTFKGQPLTLTGTTLKVGDKAPDIEVLDTNLNPVKLSSYKGKVCIISSVPSLDTPTCDKETHRFNEEAGKLGPQVAILTISMDLPFAQKRWCGASNVDQVKTFSDHREASFGRAYGVLIKEWRLLARSVFVVDKEGVIRYIQNVKEISEQPEYNAILSETKKLLK